MSVIRNLRRSNETSTATTPVEIDMTVHGQGVGGLAVTALTPAVVLKEASVYFELLKSNIIGLGGLGFDVFIRHRLDGSDLADCVIRHKAFGRVSEATFRYTAFDLKNQWVSFSLMYSQSERVLDYFTWLQNHQIVSGHEGIETPPSKI